MSEHVLIGLASIIVLGIGAQWLAWRLKFPSILFLLVLGFVAGPVTGFLHPDKLLGDLLLPVISVSVAVILFEGGLTLRFSELHDIGHVVRNLVTVGILATWVLVAACAYFLIGLNIGLSILIGAILIVTGPTVILPLLRHVRPVERVANVVKWEGIVNDPIGALLAVLVFEALVIGEFQKAGAMVLFGLLKTVVLGTLIGILAAWFLVMMLKRYWIPDYLQETVALMLVVTAFVSANFVQEESGLFAVTLMGIALANQKTVVVKHILEFKENLGVLIISTLFILLAARLESAELRQLNMESLAFVGVLMLVVRPVASGLSMIGSELNWRERLFVAWMAPRGIVAAAIASVFALRLSELGLPQTEYLVPVVFLVIVATVGIYGLTATPLARWLGVANTNPQGALIIGAHGWARAIARVLQEEGFRVLLVDTNRHNEYEARMQGLPTYHGSVLAEYILDEINLDGIGRLLALTPNDEANALAVLHFEELFGRMGVYQLPPHQDEVEGAEEFSPQHLRGRFLFGKGVSFEYISERFSGEGGIKKTRLSEEFDYEAFQRYYEGRAIPMFVITEARKLLIFTTDQKLQPQPGQTIIALVEESGEKAEERADQASHQK